MIEAEKPDRALSMLNGMLLRVLTNKYGDNPEKIRPDLNKFVREIRHEVFTR